MPYFLYLIMILFILNFINIFIFLLLMEGHGLVEHLLNWRSIIYGLVRPVMIVVMPEAT
jgi:hypothetical protein